MASLNKGLLQPPATFLIAKRFRGKINIQKPRKPHFERQLLLDFTKPIYRPPKYTLPDVVLCGKNIIFGQPESADKMFKILKKAPQLIVMAGIIQDRLMSKNELLEFSKLPSLDVARSQLCNVLQSAAVCLVKQLNQSQQALVSNLEQHLEIQKGDDKQ
ncbi:unnamed protein product, partial [Iphiclides podalirius]